MFSRASLLGRSLVTPPPDRRQAQGAQIYSEGVGRFQGLFNYVHEVRNPLGCIESAWLSVYSL